MVDSMTLTRQEREQAIHKAAHAALSWNRRTGRKVALAESCTGGMICAALTDIAGSSDVLTAGFVTYSNCAKQQILGVCATIFETFGAVSVECAQAMAAGAIKNSDADVAVAVTGIAGPGGGTAKKPVGLVVFARIERNQNSQNNKEAFVRPVRFDLEDRTAIRCAATLFALELLHPDSPG